MDGCASLMNKIVKGPESLRKENGFIHIPSTSMTSVFKYSGECGRLYVKYFLYNRWRHFLKSPVRKSKGLLAWEAYQLFQQHGFSTPSILSFGDKRNAGFIDWSVIVSEDMGCKKLKEILNSGWDVFKYNRKEFILQFGRTIGLLHGNGIYHGDLNLANILIDFSKWPTTSTFVFLDNEGYKKFDNLPLRWRIHDLRDLNNLRLKAISLKDRLRFLSAYLRENPELKGNRKALIDKIGIESKKRYRQGIGGF